MSRAMQPLVDITGRAPEAGRIRLGIKTGKAMKSIDTFRFTSPHHDCIALLAQLYGGTARPWSDPRQAVADQHEVITTTKAIQVILPRDALTQHYEQWSAGGCIRRCDGIVCTLPNSTSPEGDPATTPCICNASGKTECRPYTRLNVILPQIPFRGVWRLETKGWNAQLELPGMVDLIEQLAEHGRLVAATLSVEQRTKMTNGRKSHFVVPTLTLDTSPAEALAGAAGVRALQPTPVERLAIESGDYEGHVTLPEDEIVDAEIVEWPPIIEELYHDLSLVAPTIDAEPERLWRGLKRYLKAPDEEHIDATTVARIRKCIDGLNDKTISFVGFSSDGTAQFTRNG